MFKINKKELTADTLNIHSLKSSFILIMKSDDGALSTILESCWESIYKVHIEFYVYYFN